MNLSRNTINLMGLRERAILVHSGNSKSGYPIAMEAITENQEKHIDRISDKQHIYFYGDVNVNNPEDIKVIKDYRFIHTDGKGLLYTTFDYERGLFTLIPQSNGKITESVIKWGPCIDPLLWFKYHHCLIGKPTKVVVYNYGTRTSWK